MPAEIPPYNLEVVYSHDREYIARLMGELACTNVYARNTTVNRVYTLSSGQDEPQWTVKLSHGNDLKEQHPGREADTLQLFGSHADAPLAIPKIYRYDKAHRARVISYVPGRAEEAYFLKYTPPGRRSIPLAEFIAWQRSLAPQRFVEAASRTSSPYFPWDDVIAHTGTFNDEAYPTLRRITQTQCKELLAYYPKGVRAADTQIIHDDLRPENLVFQGFEITGIIDFESVSLGDAARAMRSFYFMPPQLLDGCLHVYNGLTGESVDRDQVGAWAKFMTIRHLTQQIRGGIPDLFKFLNAHREVSEAFDEDWSELYKAVVTYYDLGEASWTSTQASHYDRYRLEHYFPGGNAPNHPRSTLPADSCVWLGLLCANGFDYISNKQRTQYDHSMCEY